MDLNRDSRRLEDIDNRGWVERWLHGDEYMVYVVAIECEDGHDWSYRVYDVRGFFDPDLFFHRKIAVREAKSRANWYRENQ